MRPETHPGTLTDSAGNPGCHPRKGHHSLRKHLVSACITASLTLGLVPALTAPAHAASPGTASAVAASAAARAAATPYLKLGAKGVAVKRVQTILGIRVTGVFDKPTVAAVKAFQKANRIATTGTVGAKTWAALQRTETAQKKQRAAQRATLAAVADELHARLSNARAWVTTAHGTKVVFNAADTKPVIANINRVNSQLSAVSTRMASAPTPAKAGAILSAETTRLRRAAILLERQAIVVTQRPGNLPAHLTVLLDGAVAQARSQGTKFDPAAERTLRAKVLTCGAQAAAKFAPLTGQMLALDPFASASPARMESLSAQMAKLARSVEAPLSAALEEYGQLVLPDLG